MGLGRLAPRLILSAFLTTLLLAMWAGLVRLGWPWPPLQPLLPAVHGPLMVAGFLGSLIALERAVALGSSWAYAAPVLNGLGAITLAAGLPLPAGQLLLVLGSLALLVTLGVILRRQMATYTLLLALGGTTLLGGNLLWLMGRPASFIVLWWAGFLVLTIGGERLELGRIRRLSRLAGLAFMAVAGLYLAALGATLWDHQAGTRLAGVALAGMAIWLLRYDIARLTIRKPGLPRFAAACLLSGYAWLGFAGGLALVFGGVTAGFRYDALLHSIFLGFTFSMVFAHAPIILPAIRLRVSPKQAAGNLAEESMTIYRPGFYAPLILLHLSLVARVIGDALAWLPLRMWGGLFNVISILVFLALLLRSVVLSRHAEGEGLFTPRISF